MSAKISLKFIKENFLDFVSKLKDLTNIEDVVKIKIENDNILMYSMLSNDVSVLALKSYTVKTSDYIENYNKDEMCDFIIINASKFVKNLNFFNLDNPIKLDLITKSLPDNDDILHVRSAQFTNGKLKISCIGGEEHKIRDININTLESKLDPMRSKWSFGISKQDFLDVKKLCSINNEEKFININVDSDGKVTMSEMAKWEIEIDTVDIKNTNLIFGKKYLSNINVEIDRINFSMFDTFVLVKDDNSNLMLSFEQSFNDDE